MDVQVTPAGADDAAVLEALFQFYVYDFSPMLGIDVADDGRYRIPPLADRGRAFLFRVDGALAGFAIVAERSRLSDDPAIRDMAELFVMQKFRRAGVGQAAAFALFDRFGGTWEVRQRKENVAATAFWRRIIGRYCDGRFEDFVLDDARWRGPVQRFTARM